MAIRQGEPRVGCTNPRLSAYGLLDDQIRLLGGWFADTLSTAPIDRLASLRLDGDLYDSTMDALVSLCLRLSVGGFSIGCAVKLAPTWWRSTRDQPIREAQRGRAGPRPGARELQGEKPRGSTVGASPSEVVGGRCLVRVANGDGVQPRGRWMSCADNKHAAATTRLLSCFEISWRLSCPGIMVANLVTAICEAARGS